MNIKEESELKETILNRLFETSSHCSLCGQSSCGHGSNRDLDAILKVEDVLNAINYERSFSKDKP